MVGARDGYVYAGSLHLTIISTIKANPLTRKILTEKKTENHEIPEIPSGKRKFSPKFFMSDIYVQSPNMPFKDINSKVMSAMHS